ncbi:MAG: hypothetical protein AB1801_08680 [Chloroflexota bacterium]
MSAEITTIIGQLKLVEGNWRGDAPNQVAVREPKSADKPGAGKGDLFVLVEVRGQAGLLEAIERQLAETIRDTYYLADGSTTARLRRALQAAADLLYDRNYAVEVEERAIAGAVVLVMQGEDAFVAQIGPTACFALLGDLVRRYPTESAWLDEALGPAALEQEPALGIRPLIEPNLHHLRVGPEDFLVLADSGLAGQLPLEAVAKAVGGVNVKVAVKNLSHIAQAQDCSAIVLAVVERAQSALGPLKMTPPAPLSRFFNRAGAATQTATPEVEVVAEPLGQKPTAGTAPKAARQRPQAEEPADPPRPRTAGAEATNPIPEKIFSSTANQSAFRTGPQPDSEEALNVGRMARWLGLGLLMLAALLGSGLKTIFSLVTPKSRDHSHRQAGLQANRPPQAPAIPWRLLRNIAIAIPLLVAVIVGVSYLQKGRMREAEYQELFNSAQTKFEQAQSVDVASAVGLIGEAKTLLTQAEQIKVDQPEIAELRQKMAETADQLGKVQRLYFLPQLRQYTDVGTNLKGIFVQGVEVYVLDGGNGRLYHHRLDDVGESLLPDDESVLLVAQGQTVDEAAVGNLLGMVWMPAGGNRQTSDLLILSQTGLLEYHPNWGLAFSSLAAREGLVAPAAVASFFGNFYVLDPQANKLWRYLPTADGYSAAPESYFPPEQAVDLTNAVDLAIDGAVYILFRDGRIGKYLSGQPVDFNISGLDLPFNNPLAIFTAPNEEVQYIYVADAGNQRVVQLNKDGSFVRQFKPRPGEAVSFANLQDIYVDEIGARVYILDSNNLYVGNIPTE